MTAATAIEWTEVTWNPTTGCDRVSAGCDHCYALTLAKRGVSVEDQRWANIRVPALLETPAAVRFLSCEPLLGPVELTQEWLRPRWPRVDWVIAGGESGPRHRPLELDWVRGIRDRCVEHNVAFFFKQIGGHRPKDGGRVLDGRTWDEMPERRTR